MVINHVQLKTFSSYVKFDTMENLLGASPQVQEKVIRKDAVLICINIWMTYLWLVGCSGTNFFIVFCC